MHAFTFDPSRFKDNAQGGGQYRRQLERLATEGKQVDCIQQAVEGAIANLTSGSRASFVIYGEPQSGKTEMMICLREGRLFILHLLNDSVDLLGQNLGRFQKSGPCRVSSALRPSSIRWLARGCCRLSRSAAIR
jgi:hypothetical protein